MGEAVETFTASCAERKVVKGWWAFPFMEEYADGQFNDFRSLEEGIRLRLVENRGHHQSL